MMPAPKRTPAGSDVHDPDPAEWAIPPGYSRYRVARDGRLMRAETGRVLVPTIGADGYLLHTLRGDDDRQHTVRVHRLVLTAWVGPRPLDREACHIDGDRQNNHATNLMWGTRAENTAHKALATPETRRRMARLPRRASHPEEDRNTSRVVLRLPPDVAASIRVRAEAEEMTLSAYIARLVTLDARVV